LDCENEEKSTKQINIGNNLIIKNN